MKPEPTPESYYARVNSVGLALEQAERGGRPIPEEVANGGFGGSEQCAGCKQEIKPPKKVMRCSACKSVTYCSQQCSSRAWNIGPIPGSPGHKMFCADNKRHMQRLPEAQAILKSFPWGRLEDDGTFSFDLARARFGVLGGTGAGFWSHRGGPMPHQDQGGTKHGEAFASPLAKKIAAAFQHLDGYDLLHHKGHLTDEEGWRLPSELIPYRDFANIPLERKPCLVNEFDGGVTDWDSWHRWRKLPKRSPASLLMNFPLSVYQLAVHNLKITSRTAGKPNSRKQLNIHLLGAEIELNFLPLFSELALLLPHHDITLELFGSGVHKLVQESKKQGVDGSPLRKALAGDGNVFEYSAPPEHGASTLRIRLHGDTPTWTPQELAKALASGKGGPPDALIALNAGLGAYQGWNEVIHAAHGLDIPFAVTEYLEQSLEYTVKLMFPMIMRTPPKRNNEIAFNPFHRPGQRPMACFKLPNLINGFSLVVVDRK